MDDIKKMQKEVENESDKEEVVENKEEKIPSNELDGFEVINDGGWDVHKELPEYQYRFDDFSGEDEDEDFYISTNYGTGIKVKDIETGEIYISKHYEIPTVTLDISSSFKIPMFKNNTIHLTHILEEWEIKRFPTNYERNKPGDSVRGFYTPDAAKREGEEFFRKYFKKGWNFKIEENY